MKPLQTKRFFYFHTMLVPLKSGDKVAVVATAKRLERSIDSGLKVLESWGLEVVTTPNVENAYEYFAASDEARLSDLQWALDNPEIKAIIFARGGYGTTRILDQVDFLQFQSKPKWTVGFSDLTSFLLQTATLKIPSVHGPMAYTLGQDSASDDILKDVLFGKSQFEIEFPSNEFTKPGGVEGEITGGNLSLIYESVGAANEIQTDGKILFLEEIGEDFYSVDRMLNKLRRTGKLQNLKGVIIGDFTNVKDSNGYFTRSLNEILLSYFEHISGPLLFGYPGGHEKGNIPLVFNQQTRIEVLAERISIQYL